MPAHIRVIHFQCRTMGWQISGGKWPWMKFVLFGRLSHKTSPHTLGSNLFFRDTKVI